MPNIANEALPCWRIWLFIVKHPMMNGVPNKI